MMALRVQFQCISCGYLDFIHMDIDELAETVDKYTTCPQCHQHAFVAWVQLELEFSPVSTPPTTTTTVIDTSEVE